MKKHLSNRKILTIFIILITAQFSTAQFLDSARVVNKHTLTPFIHSTDTVGVRVWGQLSGSGMSIDTSYIAFNNNVIEVTIKICIAGGVDSPDERYYNVNRAMPIPLPEGNYVAKVKVNTYIPMNSVPCSSLTFRDSLSKPFIISDVASVKENSFGENIRIFPNPTTSTIKVLGVSGLDFISITNIVGQKVINTKVVNSPTELDLSLLPQGVYFLNAQVNEGRRKCYKIIKE